MIVPFLLFVLSICGVLAALLQRGLSDLILLAAPCALAALILLIRTFWRGPQRPDARPVGPSRPRVRRLSRWGRPAPRWVLIDGSNVMHWQDGVPQIGAIKSVINQVWLQGFTPLVIFDANAGYKLEGHYKHAYGLSRMLDISESCVKVVPKGTPADPVLLATARKLKARIITNDRYRDWAEHHPEVSHPGYLIRGGYRDGALWLEMDAPLAEPAQKQ